MIELTQEQLQAIGFVEVNLPVAGIVAISGPAGSGKTTLTKQLIRVLEERHDVVTCAPTNKAALVLRSKGIEDAITLHSACLRPKFGPPLDKLATFLEQAEQTDGNHSFNNEDKCMYCGYILETDPGSNTYCPKNQVVFTKALLEQFQKPKLEEAISTLRRTGMCAALRGLGIKDIFKYIECWVSATPQDRNTILIIDEASMVGQEQLDRAKEVFQKIVMIGDEYQLPPVKGEKAFWAVKDRFALKQIHRQALGSQPLRICTAIRNGEAVAPTPTQAIDVNLSRGGIPVIVWKNTTRVQLTLDIREKLGHANKPPQVGEILVCRNGSDKIAKNRGLINNTSWEVVESDGYVCTLESEDGLQVLEDEHVFMEELERGDGTPFRFGYAITAHSAQGSQWSKVMVHAPDARAFHHKSREEAKHWLYTAASRAENQVLWVNEVA